MRKILYTTAHALPETDVGYDLGRSTSNNLCFEEVLDDDLVAELRQASVAYGTVSGNALLRAAIANNAQLVEWVRPDAGGMCCIRLKKSAWDDAGVERFYRLTAARQITLATGDRFLDERRVFRLGFGALPIATFERALDALEDTCRSAVRKFLSFYRKI